MVHEAFGRVIDMTNNTLHSLVCAENIYSTIYWTAYQWGWNGEKQKRKKKQNHPLGRCTTQTQFTQCMLFMLSLSAHSLPSPRFLPHSRFGWSPNAIRWCITAPAAAHRIRVIVFYRANDENLNISIAPIYLHNYRMHTIYASMSNAMRMEDNARTTLVAMMRSHRAIECK